MTYVLLQLQRLQSHCCRSPSCPANQHHPHHHHQAQPAPPTAGRTLTHAPESSSLCPRASVVLLAGGGCHTPAAAAASLLPSTPPPSALPTQPVPTHGVGAAHARKRAHTSPRGLPRHNPESKRCCQHSDAGAAAGTPPPPVLLAAPHTACHHRAPMLPTLTPRIRCWWRSRQRRRWPAPPSGRALP
jgi:hypothetical protein